MENNKFLKTQEKHKIENYLLHYLTIHSLVKKSIMQMDFPRNKRKNFAVFFGAETEKSKFLFEL